VFRRFARKWKTYLINILAISIIAVLLGIGLRLGNLLTQSRINKHNEIVNSGLDQFQQLMRKVDLVYGDMTSMTVLASMFGSVVYLAGSIAISYMIASLITDHAAEEIPSFVLITRRAIDSEARIMRKYEKNWKTFWTAFLVAVLAGVLGNIATWLILT
jgi:hypothetical protein